MTTKERLTELWLWTVAIAMTVIIVCTAMAWIGGLALLVMRLLNG